MAFLPISEVFYSIQGEGPTTGVPSIFLRLFNCNFRCGATQETLQRIRKLAQQEHTEDIIKELMIPETGTWVCDSIPVWVQNHKTPFEIIAQKFEDEGLVKDVFNGRIHLIWTGGEPTLPANSKAIVTFLDWFRKDYLTTKLDLSVNQVYTTCKFYNEIETNGTQYIEDALFEELNQINCSAKLSNSGHTGIERINRNAINRIMEHKNYWFKFVISNEEDIEEMFSDFIRPFSIPLEKVICMPALDKQEEYFERTRFIMEMAKKYKFIGMSRQHLAAWGALTGV
jgi:7-carboxy-7-deazaguanine synthase